MKYLLDTNVYLDAARSRARHAQFETAFVPLIPVLNDILIALSARRIGAMVLTRNRDDFLLIRRHKGFSLRVLD